MGPQAGKASDQMSRVVTYAIRPVTSRDPPGKMGFGENYTHWPSRLQAGKLRAEMCKRDQGAKMELRVCLGVKPVESIRVLSKTRSWVSFW